MRMIKSLFAPTASFRRQLMLVLTAAMVTLALGTSLGTAWLTTEKMKARLIAHGLQITEDLARGSVLALLYGTAENVIDPVNLTLAFPDVQYVAIYDKKHVPLLTKGTAIGWTPPANKNWAGGAAVLEQESAHVWNFIAPVLSGKRNESPFADDSSQPELLGFVHVAVGKETLDSIQAGILVQNISMALILSALLLLVLRPLINKITNPLLELSSIMNKAELGETCVRATLQGPQELVLMAHAFNQMMSVLDERDQSLRQQKDNLEYQVTLRTHQLVMARDEAVAASRHKSEFLANMSHELRTPLNAIIGYSDILIEDLEDEGEINKAADLKRVRASAMHLLSLINSVLDLAKIEAGHMELMIERINLSQLLEEVGDILKPLMIKNNNTFSTQINDNGGALLIDAGKLRQILVNLLSNANKFTRDGSIALHAEHQARSLTISVTDTGIGIPHDKQAHIFEEFRQVDMSTTRNYGGTGLGLTISQRFCALMKGVIEVQSEPGKGSCFTVKIPLPVEIENNILPLAKGG